MKMLRYSSALVLLCLPSAISDIVTSNVLLEPDSTMLKYWDGYLKAPGYIDLSDLKFSTTSGYYPDDFGDDAVYPDEVDDTFGNDGEDATGDDATDNDKDAAPAKGDNSKNATDGGYRRFLVGSGITQIDVAVMYLPGSCVNSRSGCFWPDLGIGAKSTEGDVRYCCSNDAVELGLCEGGPKYGKLILNNTLFSGSGSHREVEIDPTGDVTNKRLKYGKFEEADRSGRYVVIFANCNDGGREVTVKGSIVWKSAHGYLPGELFEFMYFYVAVTLIYFALMVGYGLSMNKYSEANIPLEKWILGTIFMGLLETFFRTGALFVWNEDGTPLQIANFIGTFSFLRVWFKSKDALNEELADNICI